MYQTIPIGSVGFNLPLCSGPSAMSTTTLQYWQHGRLCFVLGAEILKGRKRKINLIKALPFLIGLMGNCGMKLKRQHRVNYCDELP